MLGVSLSYAREDGETQAADLRKRLAEDVPDIAIKQDRRFLEGGIGWWKQIKEAIDSVEFLILLMTPAAILSGNVQKEWRYAREQGVCVYLLKARPTPISALSRCRGGSVRPTFTTLRRSGPPS